MTLKIGKTNRIPAFLAMQVMQDAQHLEATGHNIMHLEVGQPSTPPPDAVNRALIAALGRTATHAIIHARLILPGSTDLGVKPFLVQLRGTHPD